LNRQSLWLSFDDNEEKERCRYVNVEKKKMTHVVCLASMPSSEMRDTETVNEKVNEIVNQVRQTMAKTSFKVPVFHYSAYGK
jgi:hypothetical protein